MIITLTVALTALLPVPLPRSHASHGAATLRRLDAHRQVSSSEYFADSLRRQSYIL
jgi:hypothetical protein